MFNIKNKKIKFGGYDLEIESGLLANRADSSFTLKTNDGIVILSTVTSDKKDSDNTSFLPLTSNYFEKFYSVGKIPGGFFKRESKQSEREILISRLIDRTLRPIFLDGFYRNISITANLLSYNKAYDPDILAVLSSSVALYCSGLPISDFVIPCRIGYINNSYVLNPTREEMKNSKLDLVVSLSKSSIFMIECLASEVSKDVLLGALSFAKKECEPIISDLVKFCDEIKQVKTLNLRSREELKKEILNLYHSKIKTSFEIKDKDLRNETLSLLKNEIILEFKNNENIKNKNFIKIGDDYVQLTDSDLDISFDEAKESVVRDLIKNTRKRIDGRLFNQIREIDIKTDILPEAHGSALFTRGKTQVLSVITLASLEDQQQNDSISDIKDKESFILHYNFPSFSSGETFPSRAPGRREIGHGKLAYKSIKPILPDEDVFPYTIRCVGEVLSADGSTSMATVCASSLAMMITGIPIKNNVAGVAMGLIKLENEDIVLTDIMEDEDHLGDMDFKVCGTKNGITALQMDVKIKTLDLSVMDKAISDAIVGFNFILDKMNSVILAPNSLSSNIPQNLKFAIDKAKISEVIGKSGNVIKAIIKDTGAQISISDDGFVNLFGKKDEIDKAKVAIDNITNDFEVGSIFDAKVLDVLNFGSNIQISIGKTGFLHISQISKERVEDINQFLKKDQIIKVRYTGEERGRKNFSMILEGDIVNNQSRNRPNFRNKRFNNENSFIDKNKSKKKKFFFF